MATVTFDLDELLAQLDPIADQDPLIKPGYAHVIRIDVEAHDLDRLRRLRDHLRHAKIAGESWVNVRAGRATTGPLHRDCTPVTL